MKGGLVHSKTILGGGCGRACSESCAADFNNGVLWDYGKNNDGYCVLEARLKG